jgi:hypothetical protein
MESPFQTTFIPKKSIPAGLVPQKAPSRYTGNIIATSSTVLFLLALASAAGLFIWSIFLTRNIASLTEGITEARASFEPEVIERLKRFDTRLIAAKNIIANHTGPSRLFEVLSTDTLRNVAFRNFTYMTDNTNTAEITMSGESSGFEALALQADIFSKSTHILNPMFTHFGKDGGFVTFDFKAELNPTLIVYDPPLKGESPNPVSNEEAAPIEATVTSTSSEETINISN